MRLNGLTLTDSDGTKYKLVSIAPANEGAPDPDDKFVQWVTKCREALKLNQSQLAALAKTKQPNISLLESQKRMPREALKSRIIHCIKTAAHEKGLQLPDL
jgi:ribosome-binding protein aMBF1 (putative translation factor)